MSLISANKGALLATIPSGNKLRDAVSRMLDVAENFAAKALKIDGSKELTVLGKQEQVRAAAPDALSAFADAYASVQSMRNDVDARWRAIKSTTYDPNNAAAAIERAEIRTYVRSLDPVNRVVLAETTPDRRILEAMLSAPAELSGLTGPNMEQAAERMARRYLTFLNASEVEALEQDEVVLEAADAVAIIARNDILQTAGISEAEAQTLTKTSAPWLQKQGDIIVRVRPGEEPLYAPATPQEIASGHYFANFDAWARANGYASGEDLKAQDRLRKARAA